MMFDRKTRLALNSIEHRFRYIVSNSYKPNPSFIFNSASVSLSLLLPALLQFFEMCVYTDIRTDNEYPDRYGR